ncbi:MAG: polyphosphate polymerase domain-containing protein [Clostridia bacterium]|nr:polyphosphate polymerase domain-containing protein [Clostridia bacterium]
MRHELKYIIDSADIPAIANKLSRIMNVDEHSDAGGGYRVRSVYFDDEYRRAYFDKVSGIYDRDKYRIRLYNDDGDNLFLERKSKHGDATDKTSVKISRKLAKTLLSGDATGIEMSNSQLVRQMYMEMTLHRLSPVVIVDYDRQAFAHPGGNTRVTIDRHVRSGLDNVDIFDKDILCVDAMDRSTAILEVKYDEMLPDFIAAAVSAFPAVRSALSKYIMCARFVI